MLSSPPGPGTIVRSCAPSCAVGQYLQEPVSCRKAVRIARGDAIPAVVRLVNCRKIQHRHEPGLPVSAMVGQGLAGPFAGDQDAPAGEAKVLGPVGFALAQARDQPRSRVFGLDTVAELHPGHRRPGRSRPRTHKT